MAATASNKRSRLGTGPAFARYREAMYDAWSQMCREAQKKKSDRSMSNAKTLIRTTNVGTATTGNQASKGCRFLKDGSMTVRRKVAYMCGPPIIAVTRRSTPV